MTERASGAAIVAAVARRQQAIVDALQMTDAAALAQPSRLPSWSRLTIVCHLRFGASASRRMSASTLQGERAAYYPDGRDRQRPETLRPLAGETPAEVVESLRIEGGRLVDVWQNLDRDDWHLAVREPEDAPDLGPISLWMLALLRLTEVEVHGSDLDVGLGPWSRTFVDAALPTRLRWLSTRRSNHRAADRTISGSWLFLATDGPSHLVEIQDDDVAVAECDPGTRADATFSGTATDLLAFLLGRSDRSRLQTRGPADQAAAFHAAFPPP